LTWTTTNTWSDGDTPTAAQFNAISANLDAISTHGHSGAAGDGDATLTSLDYIDYDQQGALSAPATGHTRFAGNTDGSLRYRANGAAEKEVSDTTHTHTIAEGALNITENHPDNTTGNDTYEEMATSTFTPQGAKYVTVHTAIYATIVNGTFSGTGYLRLLKAGVQTVVRSKSISTGNDYGFVATDVYIEPAASSTVFSCEGKASGSGLPFQFQGGGQSVQEVRCE
jgi:hypothetical protein